MIVDSGVTNREKTKKISIEKKRKKRDKIANQNKPNFDSKSDKKKRNILSTIHGKFNNENLAGSTVVKASPFLNPTNKLNKMKSF